jgi:hypothetical protein
MLEELETCKSGALTLDGSRSLSMKVNNSSTSEMEEHLMSQVVEMKKDNLLLLGRDMVARTRNGRLSTLMKLRKELQRDLIRTGVSTLTDHSTSDQE